jgi:acyl carrier protein
VSSEVSGDVALRVRQVIAESLCVELSEVSPSSLLIKDLGAESIDFLDIMFRLEKEFAIKIPQREIERQARGNMTPEEFEIEGILQPKGLDRLKELIPEIEPSAWREGMSLRELPALFTVSVFIGIVERKLSGTLFAQSTDQNTPEATSNGVPLR